jgi:hypothetical protein
MRPLIRVSQRLLRASQLAAVSALATVYLTYSQQREDPHFIIILIT